MIETVPDYVALVFGLTTIATLVLFYIALKRSVYVEKANWIGIGMVVWLLIQMLLSLNLFYLDTAGNMPPPFPFLGFIPLFVLMAVLFNTKGGQRFIDSLPLSNLTYLSVVRIPVEIVLWWLFIHHAIPEIMTFEGRNFDILAGITAPIIAYFGYVKSKFNKNILLGWNILCLALLINIVAHAMLSFPTVIQQMAFDQPNVGILYFPFFWLPSFVVPIVMFTHFVSIRRLLSKNYNSSNPYS